MKFSLKYLFKVCIHWYNDLNVASIATDKRAVKGEQVRDQLCPRINSSNCIKYKPMKPQFLVNSTLSQFRNQDPYIHIWENKIYVTNMKHNPWSE